MNDQSSRENTREMPLSQRCNFKFSHLEKFSICYVLICSNCFSSIKREVIMMISNKTPI